MVFVVQIAAVLSLAPLADVRVGDDETTARIEVLCSQPCDVEPLDENSFLITWAEGDFVADLTGRSKYLKNIRMETKRYGAALTVNSDRVPRSVNVAKCGPARLCFDFDFSPRSSAKKEPSLASLENDLESLMQRTNYQAAPKAATIHIRQAITASVVPKPVSAPECNVAEAALLQDAWDLTAYRHVASCRDEGSAAKAHLLARLEQFTSPTIGYSLTNQRRNSALR